jgi:hypothetical protein
MASLSSRCKVRIGGQIPIQDAPLTGEKNIKRNWALTPNPLLPGRHLRATTLGGRPFYCDKAQMLPTKKRDFYEQIQELINF